MQEQASTIPMDQAKSEMSWDNKQLFLNHRVEDVSYTILFANQKHNMRLRKLPRIEKWQKNDRKLHGSCCSCCSFQGTQPGEPKQCTQLLWGFHLRNGFIAFRASLRQKQRNFPCLKDESKCCLESSRSKIAILPFLNEKSLKEPPSLFYTLCMETWGLSVTTFCSLHLLERERYFSTHFCNHWPDETLLSWPLPFTPSISPANRYTEESLLFLASCNESEGNGEAPSHRSPGLLHKRDNEEHQTSAAEVRPHPSEIPIHQSHVLNPIDEYGNTQNKTDSVFRCSKTTEARVSLFAKLPSTPKISPPRWSFPVQASLAHQMAEAPCKEHKHDIAHHKTWLHHMISCIWHDVTL